MKTSMKIVHFFCGINLIKKYPLAQSCVRALLSPSRLFLRWCHRKKYSFSTLHAEFPYEQNAEAGAINIELKQDRVRKGEVFEWPNIVELNLLCADFSAGKRVLDIGCGTGCAAHAMAKNASHVVAIEPDAATVQWAQLNRSAPKLKYVIGRSSDIEATHSFDLITSIDVIEHVEDYLQLILDFVRLLHSDGTLLMSTPNRNRDKPGKLRPDYSYHVQEFSASDLYFVLNMFFGEIKLYSLKDVHDRKSLVPVDINSRLTPIIVVAKQPKNIRLNLQSSDTLKVSSATEHSAADNGVHQAVRKVS